MKLNFENGNYCGSRKKWNAKRAKILQRAQNKCEECSVYNHDIGCRFKNGVFLPLPTNTAQLMAKSDGEKVIKIVLTISHTDHNSQNNKNSNLRALCQKCHLQHDATQHKENSRKTLQRKKQLTNTLF